MNAAIKIKNYMASDRSGSLYLKGCTGLTALPEGLTVGGSLYLQGCTWLTALPEGLTVGYLDLEGCTGLEHYAFLQHRSYTAYFIHGRIYAGCRNFSLDQARSHWASDPVVTAALDKVQLQSQGGAR